MERKIKMTLGMWVSARTQTVGINPVITIPFILFLIFIDSAYAVQKQQICFPKACVDAQVAQDMPALLQGMQSRKSIKENEGMLFILPPLSPTTFSTKGMQFSIDIIWMDDHKKVMVIAHEMAPCMEEACPLYVPPNAYAPYVLEVNAGFSKTNDIKIGDQVKF